jgi:hypothetical protein
MVLILSIASLALAAISVVSGRVVPRKTAPSKWDCELEVCQPFRAFIVVLISFRSLMTSTTTDTCPLIVRTTTARSTLTSAATRAW